MLPDTRDASTADQLIRGPSQAGPDPVNQDYLLGSGLVTALSPRPERAATAGAAAAAVAEVSQPPVKPDDKVGAFFDVDNTLMRGASIYHFARGLAARRMFGPGDLLKMAVGQVVFRMRGRENADHIDAAREAALAFVAGHKVADIAALGEEIYDDTMADRIWEGSRELTQAHLAGRPARLAGDRHPGRAGRDPGPQARPDRGPRHRGRNCRRGLHGRLVGGLLHGEAKAHAVAALAEREGLDLPECSAYSDSANDLPMLQLVGHPNAVNPDARLRTLAREHGWPVYDFQERPPGHDDRRASRGRRGRSRQASRPASQSPGPGTGLAQRRRWAPVLGPVSHRAAASTRVAPRASKHSTGAGHRASPRNWARRPLQAEPAVRRRPGPALRAVR